MFCAKCKKKATWRTENEHYCTTHKRSVYNRWQKELTLQKYTGVKVKDIPLETLRLNIVRNLDKIPEVLQVDHVCIENQPSLKNPRMKAVADTLYTWYLIRGVVDNPVIQKIHFISPSNKLKKKNKEIAESASNKYRTTKQMGVSVCKEILQYAPQYLNHLAKYKKCDDLCDAALQGIYFLDTNS